MALFFLLAAGISYFWESHIVALVFVGLAVLEQVGVLVRATINPSWVIRKRIDAGLDIDHLQPGRHVLSLIATKVLFLWILAFFVYHISREAGFH